LSGKTKKHIKAKFFFIKDRLDDGKMRIAHWPAGEMWADVPTKPLQGKAFNEMHAKVMNWKVNYKMDKLHWNKAYKQRLLRKRFQWLGEWLSEVPPRHCRSVMVDLKTTEGYKQWTDNQFVCPEYKQDLETSGKAGVR
jgi:hypothetical protein